MATGTLHKEKQVTKTVSYIKHSIKLYKKKSVHANIKIPKRSKLNPSPNLTMARIRTKKSPENQSSDLPQTNRLEENNDVAKLAELAAEDIILKAEIQKLRDEKSKECNLAMNIPTQNRFKALDNAASTSAIQDVEMVTQEPASQST